MYAIIETGGKQYKVEKGSKLDVEKLDGDNLSIEKVLFLNDNGKITVGTPFIEGAVVTAKILSTQKTDKVMVFKFKAKKRYQRKRGHRQNMSTIEITDIKVGGSQKKEKEVKEVAEKATTPKKAPTKKKAPSKKKAE